MDHSYTAGGTSRLNESTAVPNSQTFQLALQDKHLKDQGLTRQEVLSDGNCLFRAIGQALLNNENCHITLRKAAVSFMQSNLDTFSDFFHPDDLSTDANQYMLQEIDQLSQPGEHAGQECVVALAQAFCINILVTYGGTRADPRIFTLQHHGTDKPGGKRIHIIFSNVSGGHYDAVVDSKDVMNDAVRMLYYLKTKPSPKIPNLQTMKTYCIYEIPRDSPTFEAPGLPEPSPSTDVPVSNDSSSYRCDKCDVTWTSEAFLESHNKKCHPEIHECSTQDTNVEAGLFRCKVPVCGKVFESINSLRSHYDSIHPLLCTEDVNFHNKNFRCEVPTCGKFYYTKASLKRHYVQFHPELNTQVKARMKYNKCFFPSCDKEFRTVKCVLEHMEAYHSVRMKKASLNFSSFEEFKSWKDSEEVANNVFYLKARKETHLINTISYQFVCNRSGSKRSHKAGKGQKSRIRRDNVKGSCKINATCPSRMFVSVSKPNGKVHVLYFQAHGHLLNADQIKYIPIPQKVKDGIKKLLYCGISVESIVADIQENF